MVNILLASPRSGSEIAAAEYLDVLKATGLSKDQLTQRMLDDETKSVGNTDEFQGVIVGGSPLLVTSDEYSAWQHRVHQELGALLESPKPTFFLCFGNTLLAHLTGGEINREYAEVTGPTVVQLTEAGKSDRLTRGLPDEFLALTGHTENAVTVGRSAQLLATGPSCPVQIVRANETSWACQFHAEMDAAAMQTRMDYYFDYGYFAPAEYDSIIKEINRHDFSLAHQVLRNFVDICTGAR